MKLDSPIAHAPPNITMMQVRALQASVQGVLAAGTSRCAQYHRLRRLAIRLGTHLPRANAQRKTRTYRYNDSDRREPRCSPAASID